MVELGTSLASAALKPVAGPLASLARKWGGQKWDKFIATYTNALAGYIDGSIKNCANVKNILYRNQIAATDDKYVNVSFESRNRHFSDEMVVEALKSQRHIIIRGRGGAGKTMFTKWSVLRLADSFLNHQKVPIYIELRDLPTDISFSSLEERIFAKMSTNRSKGNFGQFLEGIKAGIFIFILDAADEIAKDSRTIILKEIDAFASTFRETGILLTSRDFHEIDGLSGFEQYRTTALTYDQAIAIINRLDYDADTKNALMQEIEANNSQAHGVFLQNPLLVTILLLTYDQSKDIPIKISSFYKRAFEALYERHDGAKEIYRRDHHAGLPMDEFEKVFSTFCFGTYLNSTQSFEESDLNRIIKRALLQCGIDEDPRAVARDASESACLLVREGHEYVFVHRSFQEYFTALYVKEYRGDDTADVYEAALSRGRGESIIDFIYELNQESFEKNYVIPKLTIFKKYTDKLNLSKVEDVVKLLNLLIQNFSFSYLSRNRYIYTCVRSRRSCDFQRKIPRGRNHKLKVFKDCRRWARGPCQIYA